VVLSFQKKDSVKNTDPLYQKFVSKHFSEEQSRGQVVRVSDY
jgi:hypothetical protein